MRRRDERISVLPRSLLPAPEVRHTARAANGRRERRACSLDAAARSHLSNPHREVVPQAVNHHTREFVSTGVQRHWPTPAQHRQPSAQRAVTDGANHDNGRAARLTRLADRPVMQITEGLRTPLSG